MSSFFEDLHLRDLNEDIMKTIQPHTVLCICCLERNASFVSLISCSHSDFLNNFEKPEIKPLNQVICHRCHNMLKKIKQFKLQVEDSFKLLEAHAHNPESISHKQTNLKFHKIIDIYIPEIEPNKDEQTNPETQNSFVNITCTTDNNLENIIKEETNVENVIKEHNNFENIISKENSFDNITCSTENSLKNIIKKENNVENIIKEHNNFENTTCKDNSIEIIVKEEMNFECTDTKIQYNSAKVIPIKKTNVENKNINENTYLHKKLKNIEPAVSSITKNESSDGISLLETSLQDIVSSTLTRMLQRKSIPISFDRLTTGTKEFINDASMQDKDNVEIKNAANKSVTSGAPVAKKPKLDKRKDKEAKPIKRKENRQADMKFIDIQYTGEKRYQCDICDSTFIHKHHLNSHIRIHTGEKPYKCYICQKTFSRKETLNDHIRVHTGEKPFKCDLCQRTFNRSSGLNTHIRTHTGKNLYNCNMCERSFSRSSSLNRHVRIHTGEKPYKCHICQRSFSQSSTLKTHNRIHIKNN